MKARDARVFAAGVVSTALIVGSVPTVFAKVSQMSIPVSFNNIKVLVDGKTLETDQEPFIYDGTTYLPVRAVAEAVGKSVSWNGETQTVTLGTAAEASGTSTATGAVIYEKDGIKVSFKSVSDGTFGKDINLAVENSTDQDYTVQVRDFSVNGYMSDPIFSCDIAAGKKANDEITILRSDLEKNGISKISDLEFKFHVFQSDDWSSSTDSDVIKLAID